MLINVSYDEDEDPLTNVDIIDVPKAIFLNINNFQRQFFEWMFDKSNNHNYWVIENGSKKYCSFGTNAFIDWLNTYILKNGSAVLVREFTDEFDNKCPFIFF